MYPTETAPFESRASHGRGNLGLQLRARSKVPMLHPKRSLDVPISLIETREPAKDD